MSANIAKKISEIVYSTIEAELKKQEAENEQDKNLLKTNESIFVHPKFNCAAISLSTLMEITGRSRNFFLNKINEGQILPLSRISSHQSIKIIYNKALKDLLNKTLLKTKKNGKNASLHVA